MCRSFFYVLCRSVPEFLLLHKTDPCNSKGQSLNGLSTKKNYFSRDLQSTIPLMVFDLWGEAEILVLANAAVP